MTSESIITGGTLSTLQTRTIIDSNYSPLQITSTTSPSIISLSSPSPPDSRYTSESEQATASSAAINSGACTEASKGLSVLQKLQSEGLFSFKNVKANTAQSKKANEEKQGRRKVGELWTNAASQRSFEHENTSASSFFFDYNTVELLLLGCAIFIS